MVGLEPLDGSVGGGAKSEAAAKRANWHVHLKPPSKMIPAQTGFARWHRW